MTRSMTASSISTLVRDMCRAYTNARGVFVAGLNTALKSALGDRHTTVRVTWTYDVGNARIWGGIHFRSAVEDGIEVARKTVNRVLRRHFERAET